MFDTTIFKSSGVDGVADQVFDLSHVFFGYLDAGAGGNFQVDSELTGVGLGKEG